MSARENEKEWQELTEQILYICQKYHPEVVLNAIGSILSLIMVEEKMNVTEIKNNLLIVIENYDRMKKKKEKENK